MDCATGPSGWRGRRLELTASSGTLTPRHRDEDAAKHEFDEESAVAVPVAWRTMKSQGIRVLTTNDLAHALRRRARIELRL